MNWKLCGFSHWDDACGKAESLKWRWEVACTENSLEALCYHTTDTMAPPDASIASEDNGNSTYSHWLPNFNKCLIESILWGYITAWFSGCSTQGHKKLQRTVVAIPHNHAIQPPHTSPPPPPQSTPHVSLPQVSSQHYPGLLTPCSFSLLTSPVLQKKYSKSTHQIQEQLLPAVISLFDWPLVC